MPTENLNLHPRTIVSEYAELLAEINENNKIKPLKLIPLALPESILPYPIKTIRHALAIYLLHHDYVKQREAIEDAYLYLDNFIPDEDYNLLYALQSSMSRKDLVGEDSDNNVIHMLDIMKKLRARTDNIKSRREESIEELNALRRIMDLPDNIMDFNSEEEISSYGEVQELGLNL
ncbi:hypothetical protein [Ruegeria sp.]|uniref:hypothetical protein n=1 Tax=Ruegeria sp. TaxID=1879320 RepID=UPI0023205CBF|nr:hypothetical protein [Ruegeria sp.]MDA7967202.1 hypothetical protein [Ruegeria sp.]